MHNVIKFLKTTTTHVYFCSWSTEYNTRLSALSSIYAKFLEFGNDISHDMFYVWPYEVRNINVSFSSCLTALTLCNYMTRNVSLGNFTLYPIFCCILSILLFSYSYLHYLASQYTELTIIFPLMAAKIFIRLHHSWVKSYQILIKMVLKAATL